MGRRQALVSKLPGTTRDFNSGTVNWREKSFEIIDTGGIIDLTFLTNQKRVEDNSIEAKVQKQAREMLSRADLVLFMVDITTGLLPGDKQMALFFKKTALRPADIILVVNKADNPKLRREAADFYKLSLGEPVLVSAATGSGTGDLLDIVIKRLKIKGKKPKVLEKKNENSNILNSKFSLLDSISVCIMGKPNVGKSNLLNSILGEERVIVSSVPHTTREPQDTFINYEDKIIKLIDTAGISKKGLQAPYRKRERGEALEKQGIAKSLRAADKADITLLVIDVSEPITHQESKIAEEIIKRRKSLIIIANKWDLIKEKDTNKYIQYIYTNLPFIRWAPIQFVSALTGEKVKKIIDLILEINEQRRKEITDAELKEFLSRIIKLHKPAKGKGIKRPWIREFKQVKSNPPVFTARIGSNEDLHFSYLRFIENRLRQKFGFLGTPILIRITKNKTVHGGHNR
jgi:GTP-binding protein